MGNWDLNEFKKYCLLNNNLTAWRYAESLAFKWNAVKFFEKNITSKMSEIKHSLEKATLYDYEIAYEIDALMTALNSMWDILAQLVNECLVKPKKDPNVITYEHISDYVSEKMQTLKCLIASTKSDSLYDIIKNFSNTSKHKSIFKGVVNIDYREHPTHYTYNIYYADKKGKNHDLKLSKISECISFVGKSVDKIGAEISSFWLVNKTP